MSGTTKQIFRDKEAESFKLMPPSSFNLEYLSLTHVSYPCISMLLTKKQ